LSALLTNQYISNENFSFVTNSNSLPYDDHCGYSNKLILLVISSIIIFLEINNGVLSEG
jgi:hypothetical protein